MLSIIKLFEVLNFKLPNQFIGIKKKTLQSTPTLPGQKNLNRIQKLGNKLNTLNTKLPRY